MNGAAYRCEPRKKSRAAAEQRRTNKMKISSSISPAGLVVFFASLIPLVSLSQNVRLDRLDGLRSHRVAMEVSSHRGYASVHVTDQGEFLGNNEDKLVILDDVQFQDGTIEVNLAGAPGGHAGEAARGFVGVAFRVAEDASSFEAFYLRPTNGRADDQLRRNHSSQYISYPEYPWRRLREETPGVYESYVDLVPDEWTQVRIEVSGERASFYVHGAEQPTLVVNDLKLGAERSGSVGLWIGPGTDAHFRDLRIVHD